MARASTTPAPEPSEPSDPTASSAPAPKPARGLSRRRLLAGAGAGAAVGAFAGAGAALAIDGGGGDSAGLGGDVLDLRRSHPFYATSAAGHQGGVATLPQRYCVFMTFDLTASTAAEIQVLLAQWSAAIAQLMKGQPIGTVQPDRAGAVAQDTGEALDLAPSSLTVTLGLGPGVFDERYGLAGRKPKLLKDLPDLPSDQLVKGLTGGDLSLQACADDPQVAYHAIRDLARLGRGTVNTRWVVLGFGRASAGAGQSTPRNLLGFKDGTRNLKSDADLDDYVWLGPGDDVDWMTGGTYQVARKIRMDIEIWDADDVTDQERIFGRGKTSGAPLSGGSEFTTPDFTAEDAAGESDIDPHSHISLAAFEHNDGVKILRRGYNFTDGINDLGQLDAGLLFIAFMDDPGHFVRLQNKLGSSDLLNEYIAHIGSAVFAIPPAPRAGHYLAQALFES